MENVIGILKNIRIDSGCKTLLESFVKYEKNGFRSFLVPKSAKKGLSWFNWRTQFKRLVSGWVEDAIGIFENIMID